MSETTGLPTRRQRVLHWSLWWLALAVWTWMLVSPQAPRAVEAVVPYQSMQFWVSKCGHVGGYLVLTILAGCLPVRRSFHIAWWLFLVGHACLTEWIQTFVPGRFGSIDDVGLDVLGITLGLLVLLAWHRLRGGWRSAPSPSARE